MPCLISVDGRSRSVSPALITLMETSSVNGQVYNIGNDQPVTIEALAQKIIERTKSSSTIKFIPYEEAYGYGYEDMRHRAPSLDKIKNAIGYQPVTSLDSILDHVIEDIRRHEVID